MKCTCGEDILENDKFCKNCGEKILLENLYEEQDVLEDEFYEETDLTVEAEDFVEIVPDELVELVDDKKRNNKKITIPIACLLLFAILGVGVFAFTRTSVIIDDVYLENYPFASVTLTMSNREPIDETLVYEFYQDGELIEDIEYIGDGEFDLFLNPEKSASDSFTLDVKTIDKPKVLASKKLKITRTIFDDLFSQNSVLNEVYPNLELQTNINSLLLENGIGDNLFIVVDDVDYKATVRDEAGKNIVSANIDGAKRNLDFKYQYKYTFKDKEYTKNASVELAPYNNISFEKTKSDYSEYPIVRHYFNIVANNGNIINDEIDVEELTFFELTNSGNTPIDVLNVTKLVDSGRSSVELVADVSGSIDPYGMQQTRLSLSTFLDVVDFSLNDEVELISFDHMIYDVQRFTGNETKLTNGINSLDSEYGGATALYDALDYALDRTVIQRGSKMIIATTDGQDNTSQSSYYDVINKAVDFEIPIYIIGVGWELDDTILSQIAVSSGGSYIKINSFGELRNNFKDIYYDEKQGLVVEYDATTLSNGENSIVARFDGNYLGGDAVFDYDPIFVSWGGNVRVDDPSTPYDEREFDSNYYDKGHTYEVVFEDVSWQEANKRAVAKGGYLARITSEEEFDVVTDVIEKATTSKSYLYWLGGSRKNSIDGQYTWVDENLNVKSETLPDILWLENEPSYQAYDSDGNVMFEEEYLNMFYVKNIDKWVLNDVTDDVLSQYSIYKGKIAYVIEYQK